MAGLAPSDEVLALNGLRVTALNWHEVFPAVARIHEPLTVLISRSGIVQEVEVVPAARPPGQVEIRRRKDSTSQQDNLRRGWLCE